MGVVLGILLDIGAGIRIRVGGVAEEVRGGASSNVVAQHPRPGLTFPVYIFSPTSVYRKIK